CEPALVPIVILLAVTATPVTWLSVTVRFPSGGPPPAVQSSTPFACVVEEIVFPVIWTFCARLCDPPAPRPAWTLTPQTSVPAIVFPLTLTFCVVFPSG